MLFERNYLYAVQIQSLLVMEVVLVILVVLVDVLVPRLKMISCSSNSKCFSQYPYRTGRACGACRCCCYLRKIIIILFKFQKLTYCGSCTGSTRRACRTR
jgi:hypothetical protein